MNERQRYRVWWQCIDCGRLHATILKVGCSHVVPPPESLGICLAPGRPGQPCRVEQKGGFEQCTGFWAGSRLIFDGDRIGTDDQNWGEVSWSEDKGQWVIGGETLCAELRDPEAVIIGNSHEPFPDEEDEEEEPQTKEPQ